MSSYSHVYSGCTDRVTYMINAMALIDPVAEWPCAMHVHAVILVHMGVSLTKNYRLCKQLLLLRVV